MIDFNVAPFTGKELDYIREAMYAKHICGDGMFTKEMHHMDGEENRNAKSAADHLLYPCHGDGSTAGYSTRRRGHYAVLYLCVDGRCICTEGCDAGVCGYPSGYHEY